MTSRAALQGTMHEQIHKDQVPAIKKLFIYNELDRAHRCHRSKTLQTPFKDRFRIFDF
jgi:hypothetical protein